MDCLSKHRSDVLDVLPFFSTVVSKMLIAVDNKIPTVSLSRDINTATSEAAADRAASSKTAKYTALSKTHHFIPIAIETGGSWNDLAIEFINELRKRITAVTQEPRETQYIFQRMSVALQRGNAVAFQNTFLAEYYFFTVNTTFNLTVFKPLAMC